MSHATHSAVEVDVIILSWNRVDDTIAAIASAAEQQDVSREGRCRRAGGCAPRSTRRGSMRAGTRHMRKPMYRVGFRKHSAPTTAACN